MKDVKAEPIQVKIIPEEIQVGKMLASLAFSAVSVVLVVYLQRKIAGPDVFLTLQMKACKVTGEFADSQVRFWHKVSARASDAYLASRP